MCLFAPKSLQMLLPRCLPAVSIQVSLHMSDSLTSAARASAWRCKKKKKRQREHAQDFDL